MFAALVAASTRFIYNNVQWRHFASFLLEIIGDIVVHVIVAGAIVVLKVMNNIEEVDKTKNLTTKKKKIKN